jgi:DNA-binding MarR family transcriptional regulator
MTEGLVTDDAPAAADGGGLRYGDRTYVLDDQAGFILRQVSQRHASIFAEMIEESLTPTQFSALAKLCELGAVTQNRLGRLTAMDAATIKGVVDRLTERGLIHGRPDPSDRRRRVIGPTESGRALMDTVLPRAFRITADTLAPLSPKEQGTLLALLRKLR